MPFTSDEFFGVFAAYNGAIWPLQLLLTVSAVAAAGLAFRRGAAAARSLWGILAALWLWTGVAYHFLHFARINPAAYAFGGLFVVQALLLAWVGAARALPFRPSRDARGIAGAALLIYALAVYPLLVLAAGHDYFAGPTFGAPCPVVLFTFGMFLLVPALPVWLLLIPAAWAIIGTGAVLAFGVLPDAALLPGATVAAALILHGRRSRAAASRRPTAARTAAR